MTRCPTADVHPIEPVSNWVQRWSHLVKPRGTVLDIACGHGRHMKWFSENGHAVTGIDFSTDAINAARSFGEVVLADIENGPWPLMSGTQPRQFEAVVVTNYLWRPLFPLIAQSVKAGGLLIYETFSRGNETVGKPSRPDFLLQPAELLSSFQNMHTIAFEEGFLETPPRFVQRIVAVQTELRVATYSTPERYLL